MVKNTGASEQDDPLKMVADAVKDAAHSATEDATRAKEKLMNVGAGVGNSASRFAYTSSYTDQLPCFDRQKEIEPKRRQ